MLKKQWSGLLWMAPLSVALIAGCNSGSGSSSDSSVTASASVQATDRATSALNNLSGSNHQQGAGVSHNRSKNLGKSLAAVHVQREARLTRAAAVVAPVVTTTPCGVSGSLTVTSASDGVNQVYTVTFMDCVSNISSDMQMYQNGVDSYSDSATSMTFSTGDVSGPYIEKITRPSDGRLFFEWSTKTTGSGTITASTLDCGNSSGSMVVSMAMSGNETYKEDLNFDGKLDVDESVTMTGLTFDYTGSAPALMDGKYCEPTKVTFSESGNFSITDNLNAKNSASIAIAALTGTWEEITKDGKVGELITENGTMTITSACFTGTMTLATTTPIFVAYEDDCPTAGELKITGSATATITYTSTGGVNIDEGSNGSIDKSYKSCDEAGACA